MIGSTKDVHERLRELLDSRGAAYRVVEHEAEGRTEVISQMRGNRLSQAVKSIVVMVRFGKKESRYCLANVPGDCRVNLEVIKTHFGGTDAAVAPRQKAEELTGCPVGSIPPFSFNKELVVLADPSIRENDEVVFNAGRLDRSIFMKADDYIRVARPRLEKIARRG